VGRDAGGRSYQQAGTVAEAYAELRRCTGTQFDPTVVDAFVSVLNRGGIDDIAPVDASGTRHPATSLTVDAG
jgi:HD-GYP domain-containing protein (c-di-GMP phosphodiesterase class II)